MKFFSFIGSLIFIFLFSCNKPSPKEELYLNREYYVAFYSDATDDFSIHSFDPEFSKTEFEFINTFFKNTNDTLLWIKIREDIPITDSVVLSWENKTFEISPLGGCSINPKGAYFGIQFGSNLFSTVPGGQTFSYFFIDKVICQGINELGQRTYALEGNFNLVVKNLSTAESWIINKGKFCIPIKI